MGDSGRNSEWMKVKRKLVEKSNGFSIDIGGSVVKVVYLAKDEWKDEGPVGIPDDEVTLHMKTYPRDDIDDALAFIKENVFIRRETPDALPVIYTSGVGANMMAARFKEELSVKVENTMEFDDLLLALEFLMKSYDHEDVFIPIPQKGFKEGLRQCISSFDSAEVFKSWSERAISKYTINVAKLETCRAYINDIRSRLDNGTPLPRAMPRSYPYLLGQFGSGFCYLVVKEDGTYSMADLVPFSGRTFLDLGRLVTGTKTYGELIALAEAGDETKLNVRYCDSVTTDAKDIYSEGNLDELILYSFGKVHGKELSDVDKSDLARTLLQNICHIAVTSAIHVMLAERCQHIYLTGSFVISEVTQNLLFQEFEAARAKFMNNGPDDFSTSDLRMEIAQRSSWLGCLGAFLTGCDV